jgi:hypothetical protein
MLSRASFRRWWASLAVLGGLAGLVPAAPAGECGRDGSHSSHAERCFWRFGPHCSNCCPPYQNDFFGYFPTYWRPWPGGWPSCAPPLATTLPAQDPARPPEAEPVPPPQSVDGPPRGQLPAPRPDAAATKAPSPYSPISTPARRQ